MNTNLLAMLSDRERQVLIAYSELMDYAKVSKKLNISRDMVRKYISRAKKKAKKAGIEWKYGYAPSTLDTYTQCKTENSDNLSIECSRAKKVTDLEQLQKDISSGLSKMAYEKHVEGSEKYNREEALAHAINNVGEKSCLNRQRKSALKELSESSKDRVGVISAKDMNSKVRGLIKKRKMKVISVSSGTNNNNGIGKSYKILCNDETDWASLVQMILDLKIEYHLGDLKIIFDREVTFSSIALYNESKERLQKILTNNKCITVREYTKRIILSEDVLKNTRFVGIVINAVEVFFFCKFEEDHLRGKIN